MNRYANWVVVGLLATLSFSDYANTLTPTTCEAFFQDLSNNCSANVTIELENNIDCANYHPTTQGIPAPCPDGFNGTIYGNHHTISNINVWFSKGSNGYYYTGLIGRLNAAIIKDLTVEKLATPEMTETWPSYVRAGAVAGESVGGSISNVTVRNEALIVYSSVEQDSPAADTGVAVGGFVGKANKTVFTHDQVYDNADIWQRNSRNFVTNVSPKANTASGGFIGSAAEVHISQCGVNMENSTVVIGAMSSDDDPLLFKRARAVGGLIGRLQGSNTIDQAYVVASYGGGLMLGEKNIGGLIGSIEGSTAVNKISNSYARDLLLTTHNYDPKKLAHYYFGGLIGSDNSGSKQDYLTNCYSSIHYLIYDATFDSGGVIGAPVTNFNVSDSYWNITSSGIVSSGGNPGKGISDGVMQMGSGGIYSNWDSKIWKLPNGSSYVGYPLLLWTDS